MGIDVLSLVKIFILWFCCYVFPLLSVSPPISSLSLVAFSTNVYMFIFLQIIVIKHPVFPKINEQIQP